MTVNAASPSPVASAQGAAPHPRVPETAALWIGFALFIAAVILCAILTVQAARQQGWVRETLDARNLVTGLMSAVQDAEIGQRGYLLTDEERYLEPYFAARVVIPTTFAALSEVVARDPQQAQRLKALRPLLDRKIAELDRTVALQREGLRFEALQVIGAHEGENLMAALRLALGEIGRAEQELLIERQRRAETTAQWLLAAIAATLFGGAAVFGSALRSRRRALTALQHSNAVLDERVRDRTAALESRTKRVESLIQDMSHRIGNSLSLVTGFLDLQARASKSEEVKAALAGARQRVFSIASAQRRMRIAMDSDTTDAEAFLGALIDDFRASLPDDRINIEAAIEPVVLSSRDAAAFGVILNEWLANAVKHGFSAPDTGRVEVRFSRSHQHNVLSVCDDGRGAPAADDTGGLGVILVQSLTGSLNGAMEMGPLHPGAERPGCCCTLRAPISASL